MRNIAITGRMAAGKTTVSDELVNRHGFTRVAFAGRLKDMAAQVYGGGEPVQKGLTYEVTRESDGGVVLLNGREILQQLGQSVKSLDRDLWVRWLLSDIAGREGPFVLDDLRFPYEAEALKAAGWMVVKVETPAEVRRERYKALYGTYPSPEMESHPSETGVDEVDAHLTVDGTADNYENVLDILDLASDFVGPNRRVDWGR